MGTLFLTLTKAKTRTGVEDLSFLHHKNFAHPINRGNAFLYFVVKLSFGREQNTERQERVLHRTVLSDQGV